MSSNIDSHLARNLALLGLLVTTIGTCIAAIALIPAFGQWLFPREPLPNPTTASPSVVVQSTATAQQAIQQPTAATTIATTPAQPTVQPTLVVIEVHSDQDWQDTGTSVKEGETVTISYVSGKWSACAGGYGCPYVGPEGWISQPRWKTPDESRNYTDNTIPGCPHSALIARFSDNKPFCAEKNLSVQAPVSGHLQLRINDARISDDAGILEMQIEVK